MLRVQLTLAACENAEACAWYGTATFDPQSSRFRVFYHGSHDPSNQQRKRYGTLTAAQAHAWDASKARTGIGKLGALAYMEESPLTAPQSHQRLKRQSR